MTGYILSPAAESDVNDIWDYTIERWGVRQAASYVGDIRDACAALSQGTRVSIPVKVRDAYHKAIVGMNMVYFRRANDTSIVVVRILHQSMDVERHLPADMNKQ